MANVFKLKYKHRKEKISEDARIHYSFKSKIPKLFNAVNTLPFVRVYIVKNLLCEKILF